jgi:glycine cleavage system aminomethyltransferase T/glycine/D-amino acid oxidase-like deaminating enzyme
MAESAPDRALPDRAQVIVIGGGIVGCSVAYHLTKRGCRDVVLLERHQLTSGTTWHAAGLVTQLRATYNMSMLAKYSAELFAEIEGLTGLSTGYRRTGSILLATSDERWTEVRRQISMARICGFEVQPISGSEAAAMWPLLDPSGVAGAAYLPGDGVANPNDVTQALAAAARLGGARIFEHMPVTAVHQRDGRVTGVATEHGDIGAEVVVSCTGMWARQLGLKSGVAVPLHAAEHFYVVTEPVPDLAHDLPVLRSPDDTAYFREDAGKLMVGFFEPGAKPWATHGIPEDAAFTRLPDDWDHLSPYIERAARRVPRLRDLGIQLFFNGPESFTPDDRYILGEAPGLDGYFVAAGFNSVGFQSGGGAGRVVADWIVDGHPPIDLWEVDIRRLMPFQNNRRYLYARTTETLGLLYDMHWPFRQVETARGVRRSPFHDRLAARGACFGEVSGWERANWYAPPGVEPRYVYSYGRQNWFEHAAEEHRAVREDVAVFDQTSFGKILVQGRDAEAALNRLCTADIAVEPGRIVYTQWLNERGGVESDVTVTRVDERSFLVITTGTSTVRDLEWLRRRLPPDAAVSHVDVTNSYGVLGIMGPRSRELLASLSDADLSNDAFPFGTSREIDLGLAFVRASRITYVGELGWELYIPTDVATHVYDTIVAAGDAFGLRHAGYHALNSLRIEKAYRHWGHDMTDEDTLMEAGLSFTAAWDKPGGFVGRDALLRQREAGVDRRLAVFTLRDPEPLLLHNEPIWRDGVLVGRTTSGMFGHTVGRSVGLGYVRRDDGPVTADWLAAGRYEVEVANERFAADTSLRPPYDPDGLRTHA